MRKVQNLLFLLLLCPFLLVGQQLRITSSTVDHNDGQRPCVSAYLEPDTKEVKKAWEDYLDDSYDVDLKGIGFLSNKDLLSAEEVTIEAVSNKKMNLYTYFQEREGMTNMCVFASLNKKKYIDRQRYPDEYAALEKMTAGFLNSYLPEYYQERINTVSEQVNDLEEDLADNKKELEKNREKIEALQKENRELEREIEDNQTNLKEARKNLMERRTNYDKVKVRLQELN